MDYPDHSGTQPPPINSDWTDEELSAAVAAYMTMLRCELAGMPYVKSKVNTALRAGPLSARTKGSIEFRMQNISATLYHLRLPHIAGYLPAKNVGTGVKDRISAVLNDQGISVLVAYALTTDRSQLDARVAELRKQPLGRIPPGSVHPPQSTTSTTSFYRDPAVKRWVLGVANGTCEGCSAPAPFLDLDGYPYLEVHHVLGLASNGSDRTTNAVALCPNCHRRCHFSIDRDEFKLSLYEKIARLQIEVPWLDDAGNPTYVD